MGRICAESLKAKALSNRLRVSLIRARRPGRIPFAVMRAGPCKGA